MSLNTHLATLFDSPLWSLTLEWQFYLILPWLALGLARLSAGIRSGPLSRIPRHWQIGSGLALLAVLGLGVRALAAFAHYRWGSSTPMHEPRWLSVLLAVSYSARGKYLEVFALGMVASIFYVVGVEHGRLSARWRTGIGWIALASALIGLAVCLPWALQADRLFEIHWADNFPPQAAWAWGVLGDEALGVRYASLLVGVLLVPAITRMFSFTPLRMLGQISYSVYLWHMLWIMLVVRYAGPLRLLTVVLLVATILLWSLVAYALVEQPFLRLQRTIRSASQSSV